MSCEQESTGHRVGRIGIDRELIETLVGEGRSIAEIAAEVDRCKATIRYWLRKWDLKTLRARRQEAIRDHHVEDPPDARRRVMRCEKHGPTLFALEGRGYYRCVRCRSESVARHRRRVKETLVAEAGGRCVVCGYNRHPRALEFHHLDPREKRLGLSAGGVTLSLRALRNEAAKCVLLCSNCHAEVEDGLITLPIQ